MHKSYQSGFTLVELMVTVAILAVVASIAIPAYNGYIMTGHKTECQNEIASIKLAESEYFLDNNAYFAGADVSALETNSGNIYSASTAAKSANSECDYSVAITANSFTITASPATGGHLVGQGNMVISGP